VNVTAEGLHHKTLPNQSKQIQKFTRKTSKEKFLEEMDRIV
jgi:hypothetical protein